jgi:hypothetical protein
MDLARHKVWLDVSLATFPLWNLSGQLVGYQQYNPFGDKKLRNKDGGKYYTYAPSAKDVVWGLESWSYTDTLFLCEGVFDTCRLTKRGVSALAVFSCDVGYDLKHWLKLVRSSRFVVAVCDNDLAGKKLAKYGHVSETVEGGKDLGEAPEEFVSKLVAKYC